MQAFSAEISPSIKTSIQLCKLPHLSSTVGAETLENHCYCFCNHIRKDGFHEILLPHHRSLFVASPLEFPLISLFQIKFGWGRRDPARTGPQTQSSQRILSLTEQKRLTKPTKDVFWYEHTTRILLYCLIKKKIPYNFDTKKKTQPPCCYVTNQSLLAVCILTASVKRGVVREDKWCDKKYCIC